MFFDFRIFIYRNKKDYETRSNKNSFVYNN